MSQNEKTLEFGDTISGAVDITVNGNGTQFRGPGGAMYSLKPGSYNLDSLDQDFNKYLAAEADLKNDWGVLIQIGIQGSMGAGGASTGSSGFVIGIGKHGLKIDSFISIGGGLSSGTISGGCVFALTAGASNPEVLMGLSPTVGGSYGQGLSFGLDFTRQSSGHLTIGLTVGPGVKMPYPIPAEGHFYVSQTGRY